MKNSGHRQQKEHPKKERNQLRQENSKLKKQIARLRKEVRQSETEQFDDIEEFHPEERALGPKCPLCRSYDLSVLKLPTGKTLHACKSCKQYREVI